MSAPSSSAPSAPATVAAAAPTSQQQGLFDEALAAGAQPLLLRELLSARRERGSSDYVSVLIVTGGSLRSQLRGEPRS